MAHLNPWNFIGDFNIVLGAREHRGKGCPSRISCEEFISWKNQNQLYHIPTKGSTYTWLNGRIGRACTERRLDRSICNGDWINYWNSVDCITLTRSKSDHFHILLNMRKQDR